MSKEAIGAFFSKLADDQAFATEAEKAVKSAKDRPTALAAMAVRHGYEVTADEITAALVAMKQPGELSDGELEHAAGGGSIRRILGPLLPDDGYNIPDDGFNLPIK